MSTYTCPRGHASIDADFCSDCGAKIGAPAMPAPVATTQPLKCPDCGTLHFASEIKFCEVCGYNFETGGHGEIPAAPEPPPQPPAILAWELTVSVDPSLRTAESPEAPAGWTPVQIRIVKESSLIGRRSVARAIEPEVALDHDPAVSHRHALLSLQTDQTLALRDIGSSNGTSLNGAEIPPMTDTPLKDGDRITLGHWTNIVVHSVKAT
jgi:hypothetical protein